MKMGLVVVVIGGVCFYFWRKATPLTGPSNNDQAGLKIGVSYYPMLPNHQRYQPEKTMGVYAPITVSNRYRDGIVPSRHVDYYNPSQLYASKGDPSSTREGDKMARTAVKNEGLVG